MGGFDHTLNAVHKRLDELDAPNKGGGVAYRLYPVLDRLQLRAEGEPDCADLVGKINDLCDEAGAPETDVFSRVTFLWTESRRLNIELTGERSRLAAVQERLGELQSEVATLLRYRDSYRRDYYAAADRVKELTAEIARVRADLEAERAQLAAKSTPDSDKVLCDFTRLLIRDCDAATEFLALASLAKRIRAALKEGDT